MLKLEDLLDRAKAKVAEIEELEELQQKKDKTPSEMERINAKVKEWKDREQWATRGKVLRVTMWNCMCGGYGERSAQELVFQIGVANPGEFRYVAPSDTLALPPGEGRVELAYESVKVCLACGLAKGYS